MSVVRMRFPQQALEELRRIDPQTPVSLSFIRRLHLGDRGAGAFLMRILFIQHLSGLCFHQDSGRRFDFFFGKRGCGAHRHGHSNQQNGQQPRRNSFAFHL